MISQKDPIRILLVEDSATAAELVVLYLEEGFAFDHEIIRVDDLAQTKSKLAEARFDIVILDLNLPDSSGLETFISTYAADSVTPIIVLSGESDESIAIEAVRQGAQDYLVKGSFDHHQLTRAIRFAMERAQRLRVEREITHAEEMQQALFPSSGPELSGYDIAGTCYPAEKVSGDYYDFIPMINGHSGIVVGDVSGHGLGPAMRMAETRAYLHAWGKSREKIRSLSETTDAPADILTHTNDLLLDSEFNHFVTVFLMRLHPTNRSFLYAAAGHRGYLIRKDGTVETLNSTGPVLGLLQNETIAASQEFTLELGDCIFIPTDGIEETQDTEGELFGTERMLDVFRRHKDESASDIIEAVFHASREFCSHSEQKDDITAIAIKVA